MDWPVSCSSAVYSTIVETLKFIRGKHSDIYDISNIEFGVGAGDVVHSLRNLLGHAWF